MEFQRQKILEKLEGFKVGEISRDEIYEWALFVAVSRDYEEIVKSDKVAEQTLQYLIDLNKPRPAPLPIKVLTQYFIDCLEGRKLFSEAEYKELLNDQSAKPAVQPPKPTTKKSEKSVKEQAVGVDHKDPWQMVVTKVYVVIFIAGSILLNLIALLKSDFLLQPGQIAPPQEEVMRDAFPHLFYGVSMLLALFLRGPKLLLYGFFFIATWGMLFYWYSITVFILHNKWPLIYLLALSPILTLPPTMMFLIMLSRCFNLLPLTATAREKTG